MRILSESYNNGYGSGNGGNGNGAPGSGNNGGNGNNGNGGNGNRPPRRPSILMMILSGLMTVIAILMLYNAFFGTGNGTEVSYTDFLKDLEADKVEAVEVNKESGVITVQLKKEAAATPAPDSYVTFYGITQKATQSKTVYYTMLMEDLDTLTARLQEHGVTGTRISSNTSSFLMEILVTVVLPVVLIWVVAGFLFRKMGGSGGPMGVGKSNAKVYVQKETGVTFKDVAGEDEAKESLVEVVDFLHNPQKYSKIGAKLPKGALLVGPPGTGKTLLAKAVAGEAHVPFFSLTGSDFIELYVGVGASRVRDLFKEATKNAPCIVFIDEIDAIGRSRDSKYGGGNEEREQTLNQLLSEMDGFDSSKGILILGATNRPEILDKALLRPGRFDRRIIVDKPDLKGRVEILKVHAKDVKMDETVDLDAIALATSGAVGSDLANMINEAAINAVKEGREFVSQKDLFAAVEQVLVGKEKKDRIMSKEERRIVSYHEVGHALISALQKNSEPVQKITIVPRTMGALGYVMQVPEEEKYLNTEAELRDMLVGLVGGRAAEEVVFDTVTTGAANDIEKATSIARNMITRYGMSKRFGLVGLATVESQYLEGRTALNCSDETAAAIDEEVVAMIKESYDQALQMLRENRELMDKLAAFLIERETITGKEFMEIFRKEKGLPEPEEEKKDAAEGTVDQNAETKKAETESTGTDAAKAEEATKGKAIDVTIGEQVMTSTDPTFKPLAFEDSLQEAKEQTTVEKPENKTTTSAESKDSKDSKDPKDPMDPPQGPVGLFSHGTLS
jgi:ATP-dependent metallopeptidase hflB